MKQEVFKVNNTIPRDSKWVCQLEYLGVNDCKDECIAKYCNWYISKAEGLKKVESKYRMFKNKGIISEVERRIAMLQLRLNGKDGAKNELLKKLDKEYSKKQ